MTEMKLKETIELKEVPLIESYPSEDTLSEGGLCQYLLQPGEEHDDQRKRAIDRIWSNAIYRLSEVVLSPGNWVMYYLPDGLERAFIKEELMFIPKDTELPPEFCTKMVKTILTVKCNFRQKTNSSRTRLSMSQS